MSGIVGNGVSEWGQLSAPIAKGTFFGYDEAPSLTDAAHLDRALRSMKLAKWTFGVGDRFGHQASAQLEAFERLERAGVLAIPVWNKSNREHTFIGSDPTSVQQSARKAVIDRGWKHAWHVDADHIRLTTVDRFLACSDFFTLDVADDIGTTPDAKDAAEFSRKFAHLIGNIELAPGLEVKITPADLDHVARKYLKATFAAGEIYRHIARAKGDDWIAEVSMDETDTPQSPKELLLILAALADQGVRLQTIAPKFSGRFNKGVDYVGDTVQFEKEFRDDVHVLAYAAKHFGLPDNLKLSVHSGSDKFTLYPIIRKVLRETDAGLHIKTAGTTWLEELIGLCEAGGEGVRLVGELYAEAYASIRELREPYASVIDIDEANLPKPQDVAKWDGVRLANSLRHIPHHPQFSADMRQLMHVSFKLAAKKGTRFTDLLTQHADIVGKQVTENLFARHMLPLWIGDGLQ